MQHLANQPAVAVTRLTSLLLPNWMPALLRGMKLLFLAF